VPEKVIFWAMVVEPAGVGAGVGVPAVVQQVVVSSADVHVAAAQLAVDFEESYTLGDVHATLVGAGVGVPNFAHVPTVLVHEPVSPVLEAEHVAPTQ